MPGPSFTIELIGLKPLQQKLRNAGQALYQKPFRDGMERAAAAVERSIASNAPRGATGQLAGKLTHRLDAQPVPRYAVVKTTATRSSRRYPRYPYPKRLEFDPRSKHKDWMLHGMQRAVGAVQTILNNVAREIEAAWVR